MSMASKQVKCDICCFRDGHGNLRMINCNKCDLAVHRECYGMPTYRKDSFTCWACQAVGRSFQVDGRYKTGKRIEIAQVKRATHCDLCSISGGIHAMHPLYDNHGRKGRQVLLMDVEPRLAWVHSLCAFVLSNKGLMYGCDPEGAYDGQDEDGGGDSDDDQSLNPELPGPSANYKDYEDDVVPIHHFVYCKKREGKEHDPWTKAVQRHQLNFKCFICGADDKPGTVLRIPVQCSANDEDEFKDFRRQHPSLADGTTCQEALHVGCARWGGMNMHKVQRVYYFPGNEDMDPVKGTYCTIHAEDIDHKHQKRKKEAAIAAAAGVQASTAARQIDRRRVSPAFTKSMKRPSVTDMSVLPSLTRKAPTKKSRAKSKVAPPKPPPVASVAADPLRDALTRPKRKKWHENLDKDNAVSVSEVERPLLKRSRTELASKKSVVTSTTLERLSKDLVQKIAHIQDQEQRNDTLKIRKKFWKREYSQLATDDFTTLWKDAKKILADALIGVQANAGDSNKPSASNEKANASIPKLRRDVVDQGKPNAPSRRGSNKVPSIEMVDLTTQDDESDGVDQDEPSVPHKTTTKEGTGVAKKKRNEDLTTRGDGGKGSQTLDPHPAPEEEISQESEPDDQGPILLDQGDENEDTQEVPNRWSHLCVGPSYRNEQFKIGEWEVMEMIL